MDYVKACSREKIREVIHYCPELDITTSRKLGVGFLKGSFEWEIMTFTSNTILEVPLMKDLTEPNFINASSKYLQRVATVPSDLTTVFGKLPSPNTLIVL